MFNLDRLNQAEAEFLARYPNGFADEGMAQILKTHSKAKLNEFAQSQFSLDCGSHVEQTIANMVRCVSRSSMMSMFEKPKFRDFCARLDRSQKGFLVDSLIEFIHGDQQAGFEGMRELLITEKLARWPLMTVIPNYYAPEREVFVKPTTTKEILAFLEVEHLEYKPRPSWDFYQGYRELINAAKSKVAISLSPSNAAFSGFLMMVLSER